MTRVLTAALATVAALALTSGTALASPTDPAPAASSAAPAAAGTVSAITDRLAGQVAAALADREVRDRATSATASASADLLSITASTGVAQAARAANEAVLAAKGLPATGGSLLRLRLATDEMRAGLARGELPLVAAAPSDDEAASITAYDPLGGTVALDPAKAPERPVLVVEVDVAKALPLGLDLMRKSLSARGVTALRPTATAKAAGGYWATKVNAVRLSDDEEPWIKGDAEIFSIVGGFGLDGKATVNVVQMPYLDNDGTTYYPNQLLVHFNGYKYNLADIVMMEDDGDTNYQQLAQAIATALLTIADGGAYIPLVSAIISAIPTSWWTDDPDYVDSWYTLSTASSGRLYGARGNGWMDVAPYWVSQL
ncbi:hypothetical protein Sme01_70000 [Sphaerisporangium melleum]|uniref:DUF3103 domain-containing protein n=1 Tax=Sphaerisporangium melleum TaxID=321316 RepID=A0A917VSL2_9ACTN|nr:DUF3103 family protein [Sphaerisporangium melleum]GGL13653.1 hypothetical protein GCM10007964_64660 [Sphaerisporangium melleum]GII74524.1 hypothetical protein Sme01_70000 [Sphaerisporangium melleum]